MERNKQSRAATPAAAPHAVTPPPTTTRAVRRRVALEARAESIELSSLPPSKPKTRNTQPNSPAAPAPAYIATPHTPPNTDHHEPDHADGPDQSQNQDQTRDHHRIHLPAIHTKLPSELSSLQCFWARHVSLAVEHEACRDHLGWSFTFSFSFSSSFAFLSSPSFLVENSNAERSCVPREVAC